MYRAILRVMVLFFAFSLINTAYLLAETSNEDVMSFIEDALKDKAKYTGHVDLYDEETDKVRNLKLLNMGDELVEEEGLYSVLGEFRDVSTGDMVNLNIMVSQQEGFLMLNSLKIESVTKSTSQNMADPERKFTDDEIKEVINKYFEQKSRFTGTFDMFDPADQKMRNLEIGEFKGDMRRFGTRSIIRVDAVDRSNEEQIELDINVDNKEGTLNVKNVKIFSVNGAQR